VRNFQNLIASAVKICKQSLQTVSASGERDPLLELRPCPTGGLLGYNPKRKFTGPSLIKPMLIIYATVLIKNQGPR